MIDQFPVRPETPTDVGNFDRPADRAQPVMRFLHRFAQYRPCLVCTSGSYSYARCNVRVGTAAGWGVTNAYTGQGHGVNGSSVSSTDGAWISAKDDSGGPVFRYNSNQINVSAYGMVSAGHNANAVSCPSWLPSTCYTAGVIALAQDIVLSNNISFSW